MNDNELTDRFADVLQNIEFAIWGGKRWRKARLALRWANSAWRTCWPVCNGFTNPWAFGADRAADRAILHTSESFSAAGNCLPPPNLPHCGGGGDSVPSLAGCGRGKK